MHIIESRIREFLELAAEGKALLDEKLMAQCMEDVRSKLLQTFHEKVDKPFRLRMSNIGKDVRQLMLEKKYGRTKAEPEFLLKMLAGHTAEAILTYIVRSAGLELNTNTLVKLDVDGTVIEGELDWHLVHDDKVYDVKTASGYAFTTKFASYNSLVELDTFGYVDQLLGYSIALGKEAGGWVVYHKETGEFKVVEYPHHISAVKDGFFKKLRRRIAIIESEQMPACEGLEQETFYKKPTGNTIIGKKCKYCPYKQICHPKARKEASRVSKAYEKPEVWYV